MRKRIVITGIVVLVAVCGLLCFLPSVRVRYHHARMLHDFDRIYEIGHHGDQEPYIKAFDRHQDALVQLGFLEYKKILLEHIRIPSDEHKHLFRELNDHTKIESAYFSTTGHEGNTPGEVEIWATPEEMPKLLRIVSKHDKEPDSTQLGAYGFTEDITASEVFEKVKTVYESMETYRSEGTVISNIIASGTTINSKTSFSILLKKPDLYLISWTQEDMPMPGMSVSGAVWSDGSQPYLYMGAATANAYSKMSSDALALAAATGISGGAAYTIPSLFLPGFRFEEYQPDPFPRLTDASIEKTEMIGDEECYVISGASRVSKKETFWISKSKHLIIKYFRSVEPPEGGVTMPEPEMTDAQLEDAIKAMGQEVTEERKRKMREMMEGAADLMQAAQIEGSSVELHSNISSLEASKKDFQFELPEDAVLDDSMFGGLFSASEEVPVKSASKDGGQPDTWAVDSISCSAVSPRKDQVAFIVCRARDPEDEDSELDIRLHLLSLKTGVVTATGRETSFCTLAWSHDESKLVFESGGEERFCGLDCLDMRTGEVSEISQPTCRHPAFSPDGSRLAFKRNGSLVVRSMTSGEENKITDERNVGSVCWGKDGATIYYLQRQSLYEMPLDGDTSRLLFHDTNAWACLSSLTLSPDGKTLGFNRNADKTFNTIDLDSGRQQSLFNVDHYFLSFVWTPEGIVYLDADGKERRAIARLMLYDFKKKTPRQIAVGRFSEPTWLGGNSILLRVGNTELWKYDTQTGKGKRLLSPGDL